MAGNRQIVVTELPPGELSEQHFALVEGDIPKPRPGEALCRTILVSLDPVIRTWMSTHPMFRAEHPGMTFDETEPATDAGPPLGLHITRDTQPFRDVRKITHVGDVCDAFTLCEVVDANGTDLGEGSVVACVAGMQEYAAIPADWARPIEVRTKLTHHLGVLGITGLTAWFGLLGVIPPVPGDTVVITSAAGAVGHIAGQLARIAGARVVALTSSGEKNAFLQRELGFEAAVNYRSPSFAEDLAAACPHGVDDFFDLVGGSVLETVLPVMNDHGRVSGSGFIAQYSSDTLKGPSNLPAAMIVKRLTMQGFTVTDAVQHWPEAERRLAGFIDSGRLKPLEEITEGLENAPAALIALMAGRNIGKCTVRVAPDPR
jgi:NADPH-dependent curcumin reductase CurA